MKPELFHRWYDPTSEIVLDFLRANQISHLVNLVDIDDDDELATDRLTGIAGRVDVPCLVVEMKPIYGAEDIVVWLNQHFLQHGNQLQG